MKIINFKSNAQITPQELFKKFKRAEIWCIELEERLKQFKNTLDQLCVMLIFQVHQQDKELKCIIKKMRSEAILIENETTQFWKFLQELEDDFLAESLSRED